MTAQIKYEFFHTYEIELLNYLPKASEFQCLFFPENAKMNTNSVIIKVIPKASDSWIGAFAPGYVPSNAVSQISSCPNKNDLCVITKGQGYIIDSLDPSSYLEIKAFPIHEVYLLERQGLMLFVDFTQITAYGFDGIKWITDRLSSDGLNITQIEETHIIAVGWDALSNSKTEVFININTGKRL